MDRIEIRRKRTLATYWETTKKAYISLRCLVWVSTIITVIVTRKAMRNMGNTLKFEAKGWYDGSESKAHASAIA